MQTIIDPVPRYVDIDKATGNDRLMARIGDDIMKITLKRKGCKPMDITGRPLKGFVFVDPKGFDFDKDLDYWVQLSIEYNLFAKKSKKR